MTKIKQFKFKPALFSRIMIVLLAFVAIQLPPVVMYFLKYTDKNVITLALNLLAYFGIFIAIVVGARKAFHRYREIPVQPGQLGRDIGTVLLGYLAIFGGQMVLGILNQLLFGQGETENNKVIEGLMGSNSWILICMSLSAVFLTPFAEEYIFRGLVTNLFFQPSSFWPKVLLSGLIFSAGHASSNVISFLIYFYMGAVLAFVYLRSGRIRVPIMLHMLNNAIAIIEMLALLHH